MNKTTIVGALVLLLAGIIGYGFEMGLIVFLILAVIVMACELHERSR